MKKQFSCAPIGAQASKLGAILIAVLCAMCGEPAMAQFASAPAFPGAEGYGRYTTGGRGGKVVYANNFTELQAYLQSNNPYIILVDRDITTGVTAYVDALSTGHLCDAQDGSEGVLQPMASASWCRATKPS